MREVAIVQVIFIAHIESFQTYSKIQSAYRRVHSTETALLWIQNDLLCAIDKQQVTALILLYLSAAFDTIDHAILIHRLENWFGVSGRALQLLSSYLIGRTQSVGINGHCSSSESSHRCSTGFGAGTTFVHHLYHSCCSVLTLFSRLLFPSISMPMIHRSIYLLLALTR